MTGKDTTSNKENNLLRAGFRHRRFHSKSVSGDRPPAINTALAQSSVTAARRNSLGSPQLAAPPINVSAPSPVSPGSANSSVDLSLRHFPNPSSMSQSHSETTVHDHARSSQVSLVSRPVSPVPTTIAPPEKSSFTPAHQSTVSRLKNKISRSRASSLSQADAPEGHDTFKPPSFATGSTATLSAPAAPTPQPHKTSRKDHRRSTHDSDVSHIPATPSTVRKSRLASVYNGERANAKRNHDFHALFRSVPEDDPLIEDFGCALQKEILLQGRIYISENHLCFNANIFGWVTNLVIAFSDIVEIEKRSTAIFIPNAIQVSTLHAKNFFASFLSRDQAFDLMEEVWRLSRAQPDTPDHDSVGDEESNLSDEDTYSGSEGTSSIGSYTDTDTDTDEDASRLSELPHSRAIQKSQPRQSSLVTLPVTAHLKNKEQEARRRAVSEAGPRPNVQAFKDKGNLAKSVTADKQVSLEGESGKPAVVQTSEKTDCECDKQGGHFPNVVADKIYNTSIQGLYDLLYTGDTMQNFLKAQKNTDIVIGPWCEGSGPAKLVRESTYVKPLNSPIGPKSTKCILREEIIHADMANYVTQVTTTQTPDVPSGGSFCVKTRVCITWAGKGKVRLLVTVLVDFAKSSWLKAAIEKGSIDGQVAFYRDFDAVIRQHTLANGGDGSHRKGDRRRRKHKRRSPTEKSETANVAPPANGWQGAVEMATTMVKDTVQWLTTQASIPNTAQLTMLCMITLVIVNIFIAQKMTRVDRQLGILFQEIRPSDAQRSVSSSPASQRGPLLSGMKHFDAKSGEAVWEWLGSIDPDHRKPSSQASEAPYRDDLRHDQLAEDQLLASQMAKEKLDQHMVDLERMIQRAGVNVDQVMEAVQKQRQLVMDGRSL